MIQKITRIIQNTKSLCLVITLFITYKIYTTYQFTYFIDCFNHVVIKDPKIKEIQQVHQKIFTKHDCMLEITCFHVMLHLNLI